VNKDVGSGAGEGSGESTANSDGAAGDDGGLSRQIHAPRVTATRDLECLSWSLVSKQDPKHGRWILPLVVAALIGFTYVLVNALPPAEVEDVTTTTVTASETTTTVGATTTTTTVPPEIADFLRLVATYGERARGIQGDVNEVNDAWEAREISFGEARDGFTAARDDAQSLADDVGATDVPADFEDLWPDVITAADALPIAADEVLAGLAASDDGTRRREAVAAYDTATDVFVASLAALADTPR
jgi:hypothetical protein